MFWPLEVSLTSPREKVKTGEESNGKNYNNNNNNNKKAVIDAPYRSIASFFLLEWGREKPALPESHQTFEGRVRNVKTDLIMLILFSQMMQTPSHVLPSVTSLCSSFLQSLLVSKLNSQRYVRTCSFTAKLVVSRCAFWKLRRNFGFFCSVNQLNGALR